MTHPAAPPAVSSARAHPRDWANQQGQRVALHLVDTGETLSYTELVERADRAANLFAQMGLKQGDTLAIWLENHIRYPELIWAAKNSGITYACISSQSSVDDAAFIVDNCDARLLITSARLAETAVPVAERLGGQLQYLMLDGAQGPYTAYEPALMAAPATPLQGRCRGPSMLYSSGTTGRPKGVRVTMGTAPPEQPPPRHAMLVNRYGFADDTVLLNPGPFYHASPGRFMVCVQRCGGTVVASRKFDALTTLNAVTAHQVTHALLVPTMMIRLLQLPAAQRATADLRSLRCLLHLGAPCPVPVKRQMIDWLGPIVEELYAGTESVGHTFISSEEWLAHPGSVGRPAPGCSIRIVDEAGHVLPPRTAGLIQMHNGHRFEYHKDAEKTRNTIDVHGWGSLGDIGYLDEDGYLYLTDRQSHMIVSGGVNIYPQEAENLLMTHPAVKDVAVIGVPHPEFGESVKAVVQARHPVTDGDALAAELMDWCRAQLSAYKCPRSVDFVAQLPRNEAGKLLKHQVRKSYWQGRESTLV